MSNPIDTIAAKLWESHNSKTLTKIPWDDLTERVRDMYREDVQLVLRNVNDLWNFKDRPKG